MKLMETEDVLMEMRPETQLLVLWFFTRCVTVGIAALIIGFLLSTMIGMIYSFLAEMKLISSNVEFEGWSITCRLTIGAIMGIGGLAGSFIYCFYLKRSYGYTITTRRCIFSGGILRRVRHSVPYHKITDVEMSQNILERMLGISSLGIYTPGTGSMGNSTTGRQPEIAYVGLKDNELPSEHINHILSKLTVTGE